MKLPPLRKTLPLAILWLGIAYLGYKRIPTVTVPFDSHAPRRNLQLLLHKKKPKVVDLYREHRLDDALADWQLTGPIGLALPPMYRDTAFGNAGFLTSFVNHGEVVLYNQPYPHPKLSIDEKMNNQAGAAYRFDNRDINAALSVRVSRETWPLGYTAWYDLVYHHRIVDVPTPYLVGPGGYHIAPTAARAIHPLNHVMMYGDTTRIDMEHWSPIIWTFPQEGRLPKSESGFALDSVADGAEVSYVPPMPEPGDTPLGVFLLSARVAPPDASAPPWWPIDERFRRAVLAARPVAERRELVRQLAAAYPTHPFLDHYRVIAELGGDRFDDTWLRAQREDRQVPSWYLVAWTHLSWETVRELRCIRMLPTGNFDLRSEYIAESAVLAFRAERDDDQLKDLAARVIDRSFLRTEFRGFNYPISDFAWLWLRARP